jgi:hypothetical protein
MKFGFTVVEKHIKSKITEIKEPIASSMEPNKLNCRFSKLAYIVLNISWEYTFNN